MILNNADQIFWGLIAAERVYYGRILIWDDRFIDAQGSVFVMLSGSGAAQNQAPEKLLMAGSVTERHAARPVINQLINLAPIIIRLAGNSRPKSIGVSPGAGILEPEPEFNGSGRDCAAVPCSGALDFLLTAAGNARAAAAVHFSGDVLFPEICISGSARSADAVHCRGHMESPEFRLSGTPHPADTVYGRGVCDAADDFSSIAGGKTLETAEHTLAGAFAVLNAQASAKTKLLWAGPVLESGQLYIPFAYTAAQTDDILEVI